MPCPLCGDICRCSANPQSIASPRWLPDADTSVAPAFPEGGEPAAKSPVLSPAMETSEAGESQQFVPEDSAAWRQEVAARLNRYHSRRKPRPPRYPSLRLRFEDLDSSRAANGDAAEAVAFSQTANALALSEFSVRAEHPPDPITVTTDAPEAQALHARAPVFPAGESRQHAALTAPSVT